MKRIRSTRIAALATLATFAWSVIGTTPAMTASAQSDTPPAPSAEVTSTTTTTTTVQGAQPAKADAIVWEPGSGTLSLETGTNTVKVRVSSNEGDFDLASASWQTYTAATGFGPSNTASATIVGSNATADLRASVAGVVAGAQISFKIKKAGDLSFVTSGLYSIGRPSKLSLPVLHRDSGSTTIPTTIVVAGANACDASVNNKGGPVSPFVNYTVANPAAEMWFYTYNPTPNASIVVSLTNYTTVAGQLQIFPQAACSANPPANLGLGANPNPVVSVVNVPAGIIYFRVVSGGNPPSPAPPSFNIRWAYQSGSGGGGTGSVVSGDAPCRASEILPGTTYNTALRQQYNFFAINLDAPQLIQITLKGVAVGKTQVQVRSPVGTTSNGCDPINSTTRLDPFQAVPDAGGDATLTVGIGAVGKYYIRLSTPGSGDATGQPFTVKWNYVTGSDTAQRLFTTNPVQPFNPPYNGDISGNVLEGGVFNFYWSGMSAISGGYDTLQMKIGSKTDLVGCPQGTFPPDPSRIIPTGYTNFANVPNNSPSKGQLSFKFNKSGGYVVSFRALRGGSEVYLDEKPIRVGCGFAVFNSAASFSAASSTSTGEVAGPPIERMTGYRMSEQETSAPEGVEPQP